MLRSARNDDMPVSSNALDIQQSVTGQPWRWRRPPEPGLGMDALVDELLLARGVARDDLARHRDPRIRDFLPDPSCFQDMDKGAKRLAAAILPRGGRAKQLPRRQGPGDLGRREIIIECLDLHRPPRRSEVPGAIAGLVLPRADVRSDGVPDSGTGRWDWLRELRRCRRARNHREQEKDQPFHKGNHTPAPQLEKR